MEPPLNLTFGVEFEFVVRYNPDDYEPYKSAANDILWRGTGEQQFYHEEEKLPIMVRSHIIAALSKHGFPVNLYGRHGVPEMGYQKWGLVTDGSIKAGARIMDPKWNGSKFTGVELQTPAFLFSAYAMDQIEKVLKLLTLHFDVFVNPSCGLHVHVGNAHAGFPVRTVKNFCMLTSIFERQFNSLHPKHRIENLYAKPPGRVFVPPVSPWDTVLAIDALNTIPDIVERFSTYDSCIDTAVAYNLANLQYTTKRTIEFRQHAATLDPVAVLMWVETVTGLVSLAHQTPYPAFVELIEEHINDDSFLVTDLLHALNLHKVADYYAQRGIYTHPRQEWEWVDPLVAERQAFEEEMELGRALQLQIETVTNTNAALAAENEEVAGGGGEGGREGEEAEVEQRDPPTALDLFRGYGGFENPGTRR